MNARQFTPEQEARARLARGLRELAPHVTDVRFEPLPDGTPVIWPADNIRERLLDAADLIDELLINQGSKP